MQQEQDNDRIATMETAYGASTTPADESSVPDEEAAEREEGQAECEDDPIVGTVLSDRYEVQACLGVGGMGAVYRAEHTLMHKRVAIKVLHREMTQLPEVVERFEREAMAAAHIDHPNVASATDFGKLDDGSFFLVLEYVDGKSLREALEQGPLAPARAFHIARQIASALTRAHSMGIVHRDLKPENIMLVERDGDPDFVKVLDFGIAKVPVSEIVKDRKAQARALTRAGMVFGTPEYMAPEQALGKSVDARADIYSLGVIFYEMLTGRLPFEAESAAAVLGMQVSQPPPPFSEVAPTLRLPDGGEAFVMKLLSKETSERPGDARQVVAALDAFLVQWLGESAAAAATLDANLASSGMHLQAALAGSGSNPAIAKPTRQGAGGGGSAALNAIRSQLPAPFKDWPVALLFAIPAVLAVSVVVVGLVIVLVVIPHKDADGKSGDDAKVSTAGKVLDASKLAGDEQLEKAKKGGTESLGKLRDAFPEDPRVRVALARAYLDDKSAELAAEELRQAYALDHAVTKDAKLEAALMSALQQKSMRKPLLDLMSNGLGPDGIDWIYEVAYSGKARSKAAAVEAKKLIRDEKVFERGSTPLQIVMKLKLARSCKAKKELLEEAAEKGDARVLYELRKLTARKGCGFLGLGDCWPCLHSDGTLTEAIKKLTKRVRSSERSSGK